MNWTVVFDNDKPASISYTNVYSEKNIAMFTEFDIVSVAVVEVGYETRYIIRWTEPMGFTCIKQKFGVNNGCVGYTKLDEYKFVPRILQAQS